MEESARTRWYSNEYRCRSMSSPMHAITLHVTSIFGNVFQLYGQSEEIGRIAIFLCKMQTITDSVK